MIRHVQCVEAVCDRCGSSQDEDFTTHYPSVEQAREDLVGAGWQFTAEGGLFCTFCRQARVCEQVGHVVDQARPCRCAGTVAGHAGGCPSCGYCTRCGVIVDVDTGTGHPHQR